MKVAATVYQVPGNNSCGALAGTLTTTASCQGGEKTTITSSNSYTYDCRCRDVTCNSVFGCPVGTPTRVCDTCTYSSVCFTCSMDYMPLGSLVK